MLDPRVSGRSPNVALSFCVICDPKEKRTTDLKRPKGMDVTIKQQKARPEAPILGANDEDLRIRECFAFSFFGCGTIEACEGFTGP